MILCVICIASSYAQNDTNSPYSLFGLGIENKTATAGLTGMGNSGIARKNPYEINIYNPANLGNLPEHRFLYEFGLNGIRSTLQNNEVSETVSNGNISHVAIAFPVRKNLGVSLGLLPYTKSGYDISFSEPIEGSTEEYTTLISGSGGLNRFYIASGIGINDRLSLGFDVSFLFGTLNQDTLLYSDTYLSINDENHYTGAKFQAGLQYTFLKKENIEATFGGVIELPTSLGGTQTRNSYKILDSGSTYVIEDDTENELDDFELPLTYGFGFSTKFAKSFTVNLDYKKMLWDETDQNLNDQTYVDQSIYALGFEYKSAKNSFRYWDRVKYRLGFNYNTGFLEISDTNIDSYFISAGLGLPFRKNGLENINISYSYGREGTVTNQLIQENFHKVTLNLNLIGDWFKKRMID